MHNFETEKIIVLDTETANTVDEPFAYDIGFAVCDAQGNVYETRSYAVAEIFLDKEMMTSAYFAEKIPHYWDEIKAGTRKLRRLSTIRRELSEMVKKYDVKIISAHNARFDNRSTNFAERLVTGSKVRFFFPYGVEIWDTLKMARQVLKENAEYDSFCRENDYLTARGCKRFTAEILYRFISGDNDFIEAHTGLEDVLIEKEIFRYCVQNNPEINGNLWA